MRITNQGILQNYLTNLNRNLENMSVYQNQLSSGKEISRPSDDPFAVTRTMSLTTSIHQNEQYLQNIEDAMDWVDMSDSAMDSIGSAMNRLRELVLEGANGTNDGSAEDAISDEVKQIVSQLAQLGNTNYDGRYIFGGQETTKPPFRVDENGMLYYDGAEGAGETMLSREISQDVVIEINVPGIWIMNGKNGEFSETSDPADFSNTLAGTLTDILKALEEGDVEALGGKLLEQIDGHIDNMLSIRSELGAKSNRLDAAKKKNEEESFNMTKMKSKTEDIDFAEKIMQYMTMTNVYVASLSVGAKILQPTILDFLK
ncbi:flagellar hook-associated protein FlgL [Eubacteriales bacterium mix99]